MSEVIETKAPGGNVLLGNRVELGGREMTKEITLKEVFKLVTFVKNDLGKWCVLKVKGDVGRVMGNVLCCVQGSVGGKASGGGAIWGDVLNDVIGDVMGNIEGTVIGSIGGTVVGDIGGIGGIEDAPNWERVSSRQRRAFRRECEALRKTLQARRG